MNNVRFMFSLILVALNEMLLLSYTLLSLSASIEKSATCSIEEPIIPDDDMLIVQKLPKLAVETCDASTQTDPYQRASKSNANVSSDIVL